MKKVLFICAAILGAGSLNAQCPQAKEGPAKGGDVLSASTIIQNGGDPIEAAQFIERGITHEKQKIKATSWEKRGMVYATFQQTLPGVCPEALTLAKESYLKALELDTKGRRTSYIKEGLVQVANLSFSNALQFYNEEDYANAAENFAMAEDCFKRGDFTTDSIYMIAQFNSGLAYDNAGDIEKAAEYYQKSIEANYDVKQCYYRMIFMYNGAERQDDALAIIAKGKAQFPDEAEFLIQETNIHLGKEDFEKAEGTLRAAVANDPNNAMLHFVLGTALEQLEKPEDAIKSYKDAIAADADYADAYHNAGAAYYNQYVAFTNEAGSLNFRTQTAEIKELEDKAQTSLREAMPYLEKAHEMDPANVQVMNSLKSIYFTFDMTDKYDAMVAKIKAANG